MECLNCLFSLMKYKTYNWIELLSCYFIIVVYLQWTKTWKLFWIIIDSQSRFTCSIFLLSVRFCFRNSRLKVLLLFMTIPLSCGDRKKCHWLEIWAIVGVAVQNSSVHSWFELKSVISKPFMHKFLGSHPISA